MTTDRDGLSPAVIWLARFRMANHAAVSGVIFVGALVLTAVAGFDKHINTADPYEEAFSHAMLASGVGSLITSSGAVAISLLGRSTLANGVLNPARLKRVLVLGKVWRWTAAGLTAVVVVAIVVAWNTEGARHLRTLTIQGVWLALMVFAFSMPMVGSTTRLLRSLSATSQPQSDGS